MSKEPNLIEMFSKFINTLFPPDKKELEVIEMVFNKKLKIWEMKQ